MIGEVDMFIQGDEMRRAAQIYLDTVFKVPVEVVDVKQVRTNSKKGRFEIKLRAREAPGIVEGCVIDNANAEAMKEATEILSVKKYKPPLGKPIKTLEELRARNTADTEF